MRTQLGVIPTPPLSEIDDSRNPISGLAKPACYVDEDWFEPSN